MGLCRGGRGQPLQQIPGSSDLRTRASTLPTRARPVCFRGGAWLGEVRLEVRGGSRGDRPVWVGARAWPGVREGVAVRVRGRGRVCGG